MRSLATVWLGRVHCVVSPPTAARLRLSTAAAGVLAILVTCGPSSGDYTAVFEHGPASNRANIIFMGDGYTADQIDTTYVSHINGILDHMFGGTEDPFQRYANFFNAYRINVVSNESGADAPPLGISRDTTLGASYYWDGSTDRFLFVNAATAQQVRDAALGSSIRPAINLVTVNDTRYGGGGDGTFAVCAGGNSLAGELALHEIGHAFSGLADEYDDTNPNLVSTYSGSEPSEVNVTTNPTGAKWSRWLGYDQGSLGVVGAYEGARYYDKGLYRPSENSKMRQLNQPFDAIAREKIIHDIYRFVDPIDSYLESTEDVLMDPQGLWVNVIDLNVLNISWYVNGKIVSAAHEETFDLSDYGYGPGDYWVKARAYDPTDWVRDGRGDLEQSVEWEVQLTPEPASMGLLLCGALAILRRRTRVP